MQGWSSWPTEFCLGVTSGWRVGVRGRGGGLGLDHETLAGTYALAKGASGGLNAGEEVGGLRFGRTPRCRGKAWPRRDLSRAPEVTQTPCWVQCCAHVSKSSSVSGPHHLVRPTGLGPGPPPQTAPPLRLKLAEPAFGAVSFCSPCLCLLVCFLFSCFFLSLCFEAALLPARLRLDSWEWPFNRDAFILGPGSRPKDDAT